MDARTDQPKGEPVTDRAREQLAQRTARDRSIALLLVGTLLLLPPFAGIFLVDGRIAGIPIPLAYVLAVWALLIAGAAILSSTLRDSDQAAASTSMSEAGD